METENEKQPPIVVAASRVGHVDVEVENDPLLNAPPARAKAVSPLDDDIFSDEDEPSPLAGLGDDGFAGDEDDDGPLLGKDELEDAVTDLVGGSLSEDPGMDEASSEDEGVGILHIFNVNCLKCTALVPEMDGEDGFKMFKKCHFDKGNEDCPARTVNIVRGVPVSKVVNRILEAEANSDTLTLGQTWTKLSARDPSIQQMVADALQAERERRARKATERRQSAQVAERAEQD